MADQFWSVLLVSFSFFSPGGCATEINNSDRASSVIDIRSRSFITYDLLKDCLPADKINLVKVDKFSVSILCPEL